VITPRWVWPALTLATLVAIAVWGRVMMLAWELKSGSTEAQTSYLGARA
jgi:hypothetical protein